MTFFTGQKNFFKNLSILEQTNFSGTATVSNQGSTLTIYSFPTKGKGLHQIVYGFSGAVATPEPAT